MNVCAVCDGDGGWHNCICGRVCHGLEVLEYHIQRVGCNDPHDLSAHKSARHSHARAQRPVEPDVSEQQALEDCEVCGRQLEIDAALRAAHLAAHEARRYWCAVCRKSFANVDEWAIMRHENSAVHKRSWRASLLAGSMRRLPVSSPRGATKRRLDAAARTYDQYRREDVSTDNAAQAPPFDDGFDGGDAERSTEKVNDDESLAQPQAVLPVAAAAHSGKCRRRDRELELSFTAKYDQLFGLIPFHQ
jgi:hypothetical protein